MPRFSERLSAFAGDATDMEPVTEPDDVDDDGPDDSYILKRMYYAAKEGMAIALYNLLSEIPYEQANRLINKKVIEEDGQKYTPLIVAARYGRNNVVKMLIEKFKPDLEEEGTVKFDGYVIEGASALWCAAGAGNLTVVKTLVKAGADIDHVTDSYSSPVRAACFDGHLDIVKYLTEHDANLNLSNSFDNTCLMIAAYKGHVDVVAHLLEKGADPNEQALCGATALHFAAECGHKEIVSVLLKHGAEIMKNVSGMTPIIAAAERTKADVVNYLVKKLSISKEETIDAFELLGASYANDKDDYSLPMAYYYLHEAMELRYSDPDNIIHKQLGEPIKAYEYWRECETLRRLESIEHNPNAIHMESLAIRERILGPHNPEVPPPIVFRGAVFADNARFDRCIELWLHALELRQLNNVSIMKDLLRFAQVFSQMVHVGVDLDFCQVLSVLEASVTWLSRNKDKVSVPDSNDDPEQHMEEMESNITTTLYILTIIARLLAIHESSYEQSDVSKAHQLVHKLCSLNVRLKDGQTFIHLAVNAETPVDDFHTNDVCKFPCPSTAKLLIRCGANVNAMDNERNTPLHIIAGYRHPINDFITLHSIITELIKAGAHMDTVNAAGKTPYDAVTSGVAEIILKFQRKLSLQCMAAKVVKDHKLNYSGNVPRCLESFIELHGTGLNQS